MSNLTKELFGAENFLSAMLGKLIDIIFAAIGMAMGLAALVLNLLDPANASTSITLLGIASFCFGVLLLDMVQETTSEWLQLLK
jgi:hypothetical protein